MLVLGRLHIPTTCDDIIGFRMHAFYQCFMFYQFNIMHFRTHNDKDRTDGENDSGQSDTEKAAEADSEQKDKGGNIYVYFFVKFLLMFFFLKFS